MAPREPRSMHGWRGKVVFGPSGLPPAFRPGQVLIKTEENLSLDELVSQGVLRADDAPPTLVREGTPDGWTRLELPGRAELPDRSTEEIEEVTRETLRIVDALRARGQDAQPNHVFFADPFTANPFTANPFTANPFTANPFTANPFTANPFTANENGWPSADAHETGIRPSTAEPVDPPAQKLSSLVNGRTSTRSTVRPAKILVLDTGLPTGDVTDPMLTTTSTDPEEQDKPDAEQPTDGRLDPAAGHGMFIKSIITRLAPSSEVDVVRVLDGLGAGDEREIHAALMAGVGKYDLVNLSFGTYTPYFPKLLWEAITALQRGAKKMSDPRDDSQAAVVVASAGNDGTSAAPMPASLPGVVSVAALDESGCSPAWFSNYGPWVTACAPGTKIHADFWTWMGERTWTGGARWSGTSFAAPYVVGALAQEMGRRAAEMQGPNPSPDARDAVTVLLHDPTLPRLPWHGTIVKGRSPNAVG